jgi:hypothetical protein
MPDVPVCKRDEEVALSARLPFAVLETHGLDRHARGVRRQAERRRDRLFACRLDDAAEGRSDVLGVAAHRAPIEREALAGTVLLAAVERDAEHVLHRQKARDHRGGEHAPLHDFLRHRYGHDAKGGSLVAAVVPPSAVTASSGSLSL